MEHIDECYHQYERLHQQQPHHFNHIKQQQSADPNFSTVALQSLDTVRALHQTVVHLRTALQKANQEIDSLKKQINVKDTIEEGKKYREQDLVESSKHLNDLLLNIDLSEVINIHDDSTDRINLQTQSNCITDINVENNEKPSTIEKHSAQSTASSRKGDSTNQSHSTQHHFHHSRKAQDKQKQTNSNTADTTITRSERQLPQMASKIDVKIKLTSNFQIDGNDTSSETTGDSASGNLCEDTFL